MRARRLQAGMTMIEIAVVLAILAILVSGGAFALNSYAVAARVKADARAVADLLQLGRGEAIRTGINHIAFIGIDSVGANLILDDGITQVWASLISDQNGNGAIDPGETVHYVIQPPAGTGIVYGRSVGRPLVPSNTGAMMGDPFAGTPQEGTVAEVNSPANFRHPTDATAVNSWVLFMPDGTPRSVNPDGGGGVNIGTIGSGDGGIYVTNNTTREYAIVMAPLGTVRAFVWDTVNLQWR